MDASMKKRGHTTREPKDILVELIAALEERAAHKLSKKELIENDKAFGVRHYGKDYSFVPHYADGLYVYGLDGRRMLDLNATYSAIATGHGNFDLMLAFVEQAAHITSTQNRFLNTEQPLLLKRLCGLLSVEKFLLMNSGAEAVEAAMKAARRWAYDVKKITGEAEIISCGGNFHGRTMMAISLSANEDYKRGFGPLVPGVKQVPFGDIAALRAAITKNTAGFLFEPIQAEGGVNIPTDDYLLEAERLCRLHNVLVIADEVQTGLGRTGTLLGCEHFGVKPDLITLGKALGQIYPVSGVGGSAEVLGVFDPGSHGSTFGGTALPCHIANKSLDLIVDGGLIKNSRVMGSYFLEQLRTQIGHLPFVKDVRGKGLLIGIEFDTNRITADQAFDRILREGAITGIAGDHNVIRISPALTIARQEVNFGVSVITQALSR